MKKETRDMIWAIKQICIGLSSIFLVMIFIMYSVDTIVEYATC